MQRLTREQAAIIGAYTGFTAGNFADVQLYADKILGRPTWTHEFANEKFAEELREKAKPDFLAICNDITMSSDAVAEMDIRLQKFDFAFHVGWTAPDGYGHTRRVATAREALAIVEALVSGPWLTQEGEQHVTR